MKLKTLTNPDLLNKLKSLIADERKLKAEMLHYLAEVESRFLFSEMGYSSLYEFCVKYLALSDGSAYRRIQSMRLLKTLSEPARVQAENKIESGNLSLTNLSLLHGFLKTEKKECQKTYSQDEKMILIQSIENKPKREVERNLAAIQPAIIKKEKERVISNELTEIKFVADAALMNKLTRIKEVLAHSNPNPSYLDLVHKLADEFLERKDPIQKAKRAENRNLTKAPRNSPPAEEQKLKITFKDANTHKTVPASRYIPSLIKHAVWNRDRGICTYENPQTKIKCESSFGLELDHVHPYCQGGPNTIENLRLRCKAHNQLHAVKMNLIPKIA